MKHRVRALGSTPKTFEKAEEILGSRKNSSKCYGSTDMTAEIAEKLGAEVIRHGRNLGARVDKEAEPFTTRVKTPDSSKAKRDLDFRWTVPLEEGIRELWSGLNVFMGGQDDKGGICANFHVGNAGD